MEEFHPDDHASERAAEPVRGQRPWIGPTVFLLAIAVPVAILIFSNADSTDINFAWFHGLAPRWLILTITFVAGAVATRLFGWVWRSIRRRQQV